MMSAFRPRIVRVETAGNSGFFRFSKNGFDTVEMIGELSTCHGVKLVKRKNGKGYCCSQCGFVACDSPLTQLQIDMK